MPHKYVSEQMTTEVDAGARFRRTLIRVMLVQIVSLIILWLVQRHYTP